MKQIIVNVGDLTIKEKQRVNEALAKIQNIPKIKDVTTGMAWFYAPSEHGLKVGWNSFLKRETPTHSPQQVLEMAGMEKKGHIHAELMAQYAEDAMTNDKPWEMYQIKTVQNIWKDIGGQFIFDSNLTYRRKPKTHTVHGVEIPDLRVSPKYGEYYYLANPVSSTYYTVHKFIKDDTLDIIWVERGLAYQHTEEGSQAAILHSKAMLGIAYLSNAHHTHI